MGGITIRIRNHRTASNTRTLSSIITSISRAPDNFGIASLAHRIAHRAFIISAANIRTRNTASNSIGHSSVTGVGHSASSATAIATKQRILVTGSLRMPSMCMAARRFTIIRIIVVGTSAITPLITNHSATRAAPPSHYFSDWLNRFRPSRRIHHTFGGRTSSCSNTIVLFNMLHMCALASFMQMPHHRCRHRPPDSTCRTTAHTRLAQLPSVSPPRVPVLSSLTSMVSPFEDTGC
ncbi:MAG: hypothetical protein ACPH9F_08035 [Candidatus Poseidoniaceae archaeon]